MRPTIYLSGPITLGNRQANFDQAAAAQRWLMGRGFAVLNPMLSIKLPWAFEVEHDAWIENDLPFVAKVDAVLRLPGESIGADRECEFAVSQGIPVFHDISAILREGVF